MAGHAGTRPAERRAPYLPAAVLGNGELLVTLSARGEVERLFWPHVDGPEQLGELRLAFTPPRGTARPLDEPPFTWEQEYEGDTTALRTLARDGDLSVELLDLADPGSAVLARRVRASDAGAILVAVEPSFDGGGQATAGYVDPATGGLVFYGRGIALAVLTDPLPHDAAVRRAGTGERAQVEHRFPVAGELDVGVHGEATVYAALGAHAGEALGRASAARAEGFEALLYRRRRRDCELLAASAPPAGQDDLYRRSLLVLETLTDRATGAAIAAPECDPSFAHSGGYGFVWPRDLCYGLLALLAAGRAEQAAAGLRWLARVQAPDGLWLQRYWVEGAPAPAWSPHQLDETGIVLFAYEAAWRELADEALDSELWPSARAAASFLARVVDDESGLLLPSIDLWEQDDAQHAYTSAAAVGGLRAAAALAQRNQPELADEWLAAAATIAAAIDEHLWSEADGHYVRARLVARDDEHGEPVPRQFVGRPAFPARTVRSVDPLDRRLDSSLLGLAWPFAAVDPASARMTATAAAVQDRLAAPGGGLLRHEEDSYRGGNCWPLCTLWAALYRRLIGDEGAALRAAEWARSRATPLGLLPEQSHADGTPAWVLPLGWSHAFLVLALRPELRLVAESALDVSAPPASHR